MQTTPGKRGREDALLAALSQDVSEIENRAEKELAALIEGFRSKGVNLAPPPDKKLISLSLSAYRHAWMVCAPLIDAGLASSKDVEGAINSPNFLYGSNSFLYKSDEKGFLLHVKAMYSEMLLKMLMVHDRHRDVRGLGYAIPVVIESISPEIYELYQRCNFPEAMSDVLNRNIKQYGGKGPFNFSLIGTVSSSKSELELMIEPFAGFVEGRLKKDGFTQIKSGNSYKATKTTTQPLPQGRSC